MILLLRLLGLCICQSLSVFEIVVPGVEGIFSASVIWQIDIVMPLPFEGTSNLRYSV